MFRVDMVCPCIYIRTLGVGGGGSQMVCCCGEG